MLPDDKQGGAHGPRAAAQETATPQVVPVVDVVACDAADVSSVVAGTQALRAEARVYGSAEAWLAQYGEPSSGPPTDLAVVVGRANRLIPSRLIAQAAPRLGGTALLAAVADPSLDDVAELLRQGAAGFIDAPTNDQRVRTELAWRLERAARSQPARREAAVNRRNHQTLTQAEVDVLNLMFEGQANKQIAQKLSIGLRTVELRRSKILRKMQATNLAQLIRAVCSARGIGGGPG